MAWQRIVAQVVITTTQIVGKAFIQAYQQAAANAGKTAAKGAGGVVRRGQMTRGEALDILNFKMVPEGELPIKEELEEAYRKYFEANEPSKGGSYYLQSKFFRAYEHLEQERAEMETEQEGAKDDGGSEADDTAGNSGRMDESSSDDQNQTKG
jgi:mitochondrial import inner membrane translocase subunit TIM16